MVDLREQSTYYICCQEFPALPLLGTTADEEVERLAGEVAELAGESKTEAVRRALLERKGRLALRSVGDARPARLKRFLEHEVWPLVPDDELGRRLTRAEEAKILGYGAHGI